MTLSVIVNGGAAITSGFTDQWVHSTSVPLPSGRAAFDGNTWARVLQLAAYASGRGASRTASLSIESVGGTSNFAIGSAGSAGYTGAQGCNFYTLGGSGTFRITANGSFYFGRGTANGGTNTTDNNALTRSDGALYSEIYYVQVPNVPLTPGVTSPAAGQATVTWATPTDDGGDPINGYHVQYATNPGFTTGVGAVDVGVVTTTTISGLTPGSTYYFRVMAKNDTSTGAGTYGPASSTVSAVLGTVPGAPLTLATSLFGTTCDLTWLVPSTDGGVAIDQYKIEVATDSGFVTIVQTITNTPVADLAKTITKLAAGGTYWIRVTAHNSVGYGAASSSTTFTMPVRSSLGNAALASVSLAGVQVELRSDAAQPPVVTLGFTALTDGTSFTSIATLTTDAGAGSFRAEGVPQALTLAADPSGNVYVIGVDDGNPNAVRIHSYAKGTGNTWALQGQLSQALAVTNDVLAQVAACYVPGSGGSPVPSLFLLARRAGNIRAGNLSFGLVDLTALAASAGSLFLSSGSDPSWLPTSPTSGKGQRSAIDVAQLVSGSQRLALVANGPSVVDVVNGVITTVAKSADGTAASANGAPMRTLGISSSSFAVLAASGSDLVVTFYNAGTLSTLGTATILGSTLQGGSAATPVWDAFYDRVAQLVRVYYVTSGSARQVGRRDVSSATFAAAAEVVVTSALGAASSTNGRLRVPRAVTVDERRVLLEGSNTLSGVASLSAVDVRDGEVAPGAPTLTTHGDYDAISAGTFTWTFTDSNTFDAQTAFQLVIEKVSDGSSVYDSGKVTSATASRTVAGATLTNGTAYRWKVRTYDALDQASSYSSYGTFTATSNGTLTITNPVADNPVGYNLSSVALTWTYAQTNGYTQTSYRVRLIRVSDSSVISDTGVVTSTSQAYTLTGLSSGVGYQIELTIVNSHGTSVVTTRTLTPSYSQPLTPTAVLTQTEDGISIAVTNPVPTGSEPAVVANWILRKTHTGTDPYIRIAIIAQNGTYIDHQVASGVSYDYEIVGSST